MADDFGLYRNAAAIALSNACRAAEAARAKVCFALKTDFAGIHEEMARADEQFALARKALEEAERALDVAAIVHGSGASAVRTHGANDDSPEPAA